MLTDASGVVLEAAAANSEICLLGGTDPANESGRIVFLPDPATTDLMTLSSSLATQADAMAVSPGTDEQVRFVVDGAYRRIEEVGVEQVHAAQKGVPVGVHQGARVGAVKGMAPPVAAKFEK